VSKGFGAIARGERRARGSYSIVDGEIQSDVKLACARLRLCVYSSEDGVNERKREAQVKFHEAESLS
jgi:hypothetical protein